MPVVKLTGFIGEQPRIIPRLMPDRAAQSAVNTRLEDGSLTPMRAATLINELEQDSAKTIFLHQSEWLAWDTVVHAAQGPVAQDRLYYTGAGAPKMLVGEDEYNLAVPFPDTALSAALSGSGSGDVETRAYVYTWVTEFGEESEPCPLSNTVDWQPGYDVTLSGFAATPAGRGITHQRIYRTQTGSAGTALYFIAERAASNANFTDDIAQDAFGEVIPSTTWNAPPDGLKGLVSLQNGMMAAFKGRDVYFCEPYRPHAWPEEYVQTVDSDVVGLAAAGPTLIVLTNAQPYLGIGTSPQSVQMLKLEQKLPCINERGIVSLGYAVAYPSHEGLVVVTADGGSAIATRNIFTREKWLALRPKDMIGSQINGRYAAFYDTVGPQGEVQVGVLLIDLAGEEFLIRADAHGTAAYFDVFTGAMYFVAPETGNIMRFDTPKAQRLSQYWKSKEFVLPYPENFGAILIDSIGAITPEELEEIEAENALIAASNAAIVAAGTDMGELNGADVGELTVNGDVLQDMLIVDTSLVVTVFADKVPVANITRANEIVRLPSGFLARTWEIAAFGTTEVSQIVMAKTVDELKGAL